MTSKKMAVGLTCCYFKHLGWPARQIMTNPILTAIIGAYMDTKLSTRRISGFIRANALNMSDYIKQDYRCFNDFFTRQVKAGARPINTDRDTLISPCDGYMSAYKISSDSEFSIKNSYYNVEDLVGGADIADDYINGTCLVLRLGVENYHRYCYIDDGFKSRNWHIRRMSRRQDRKLPTGRRYPPRRGERSVPLRRLDDRPAVQGRRARSSAGNFRADPARQGKACDIRKRNMQKGGSLKNHKKYYCIAKSLSSRTGFLNS